MVTQPLFVDVLEFAVTMQMLWFKSGAHTRMGGTYFLVIVLFSLQEIVWRDSSLLSRELYTLFGHHARLNHFKASSNLSLKEYHPPFYRFEGISSRFWVFHKEYTSVVECSRLQFNRQLQSHMCAVTAARRTHCDLVMWLDVENVDIEFCIRREPAGSCNMRPDEVKLEECHAWLVFQVGCLECWSIET